MKNKTIKKTKERMRELKSLIHKHDHFYYNLDRPEINDYEYDQLFNELKYLEKQHPDLIEPDSPSHRVPGKALSHFEKATHKKDMLSLQNTYNEEEIISFYEKTQKVLSTSLNFLLEPKLDGVAVNLIYEKGCLTKALTRGDGHTGENVLKNIKTIRTIPLQLPISTKILEIRGEVVLLKEDFKKINKMQEEQGLSYFANPRNMAAGSLRQLDSRVTARRPLKFFAHSPGFSKGIELNSQSDFLKKIKTWGLPALPIMNFDSFQMKNKDKRFPACALCKNETEILKYFHIMEKARHQFPFEIDGIVIKVNNFFDQEKMGFISRSPRWAKAAKFKPERATSFVQNISIQVGRTGVLTPVAHVKPVAVGGVTITHATLHNQSEIHKKDIRIGDAVIVDRAGDVIPEIVQVDFSKRKKTARVFKMPETCPSCSSKVEITRDIVFCVNSLCPAATLQSLIHFASKKAMNIEFLGNKIMEKLYKEKAVQKFSDIYRLTKEKLLSLEGMGEKSSRRILSSIEKSKEVSLSSFIFALNIRHIGEQTARNLSAFSFKTDLEKKNKKAYSSPASLFLEEKQPAAIALYRLATAQEEELQKIPDIGIVVARSLLEAFSRNSFVKEIRDLFSLGLQITGPEAEETFKHKPFTGQKIAITGSLPQSRDQVKKLILSLGGQTQNMVNKKTDFLLTGTGEDRKKPSQKTQKAKELNIAILDWDTFQKNAGLN